MDTCITIYTDGACTNNQNKKIRKGGFGVFFADNDSRNCSIKLTGDKITNQVAELSAVLYGIEKCIESNELKIINIITDSMYIINSITMWCKGWERKGWKKADGSNVENLELIKKIYNYTNTEGIHIKFKHVRSHQNEPSKESIAYADWYGNMMADKLATNAANL